MWKHEEFAKLNEGEQSLVKWQYNQHGGFFTALWKAISTADTYNQAQLAKAFPLHVEAYRRFACERGWWEAIQTRLFVRVLTGKEA